MNEDKTEKKIKHIIFIFDYNESFDFSFILFFIFERNLKTNSKNVKSQTLKKFGQNTETMIETKRQNTVRHRLFLK